MDLSTFSVMAGLHVKIRPKSYLQQQYFRLEIPAVNQSKTAVIYTLFNEYSLGLAAQASGSAKCFMHYLMGLRGLHIGLLTGLERIRLLQNFMQGMKH